MRLAIAVLPHQCPECGDFPYNDAASLDWERDLQEIACVNCGAPLARNIARAAQGDARAWHRIGVAARDLKPRAVA